MINYRDSVDRISDCFSICNGPKVLKKTVRDICRHTRQKYYAKEKSVLSCREGISPGIDYRWSKEFIEKPARNACQVRFLLSGKFT